MSMRLVTSLLPWIIVLIASIAWYGLLGWGTLERVFGRIGGYWFLIGLIVIVDLIAAGRLGADMGLPALFRDDPLRRYTWHSRAVWGACTATYLVGLVWIIIYLLLFIDPNNFNTLPVAYPPPTTFREDLSRWAIPSRDVNRFRDYGAALKFLAATTPPFLLLLAMIGAFPDDVIGTSTGWNSERWRRAGYEFFEYAIGILIGLAAVCVFVWATWYVVLGPIETLRGWIGVPRLWNLVWPYDPETPMRAAAHSAAWAVLVVNALVAIYPFIARQMTPSFAVGMLLCLVALGYHMLIGAPRPLRVPMVIVVAIYVAWSNGDPYKYRFPGMDTAAGSSYYLKDNLDTPAQKPDDPKVPLLDDTTVLNRWKARLKEDKPRLVLIAASGGGYRASFWTATVIDTLAELSAPGGDPGKRLVGLTDRIRLITGASGGMVGASHYVAMRAGATLPKQVVDDAEHASGRSLDPTSVVDVLWAETELDSLSKVVQQLVQRDLPMVFCPISHQKTDRGIVFEDEWTLLKDLKFSDLLAGEKDGSLPSLIVSPMIIETGGRLLISNLNVDAVVEPLAASGVKYPASGRVFFRRFPGAQGTFLLKTAARMSASFPYVLPAVNLPTDPPARIVDAGYYDNFGVNLAAAWAYNNRDWIARETSGLALIQINAFPRELDPFTAQPKPAGAPTAEPKSAGDVVAKKNEGAFQWLTSPLEGGAAARDWSMYYRNQEQLRLLDDTFNEKPNPSARGGQRFFEWFAFTNEGNAAMNVIISKGDIAAMRAEFSSPTQGHDQNHQTMGQLIDWWNGRPIPVEMKVRGKAPTDAFQSVK